eukprot:1152598-Pelagomonas_calceolata.AAC.6
MNLFCVTYPSGAPGQESQGGRPARHACLPVSPGSMESAACGGMYANMCAAKAPSTACVQFTHASKFVAHEVRMFRQKWTAQPKDGSNSALRVVVRAYLDCTQLLQYLYALVTAKF